MSEIDEIDDLLGRFHDWEMYVHDPDFWKIVGKHSQHWNYSKSETIELLQALIEQKCREELQYLLDNASGGGDWRRIATQRITNLSAPLQPIDGSYKHHPDAERISQDLMKEEL